MREEPLSHSTADRESPRQAEFALRESQNLLQAIFDSIDQGLEIIDLIGEEGAATDYRILAVNPARQRMTGFDYSGGKRVRELVPDIGRDWLDQFDEVARTGRAGNWEKAERDSERWFGISATRVGGEGSRRLALLFTEITERKRREHRASFLDALTRDFAIHASPDEITQAAGERLAAHLDLASVNFLDVDDTREKPFILRYFWGRAGIPDLRGEYNIRDYLTEEFERSHRAGETWIVRDTATDPHTDDAAYAPLQIRSFVSVPFIDQGVWTHYFVVSDSKPRDWRPDEIELIQEVGHRVFPRIERARAATALIEARIEHEAELRSRRRIIELFGTTAPPVLGR